MFRKRKDTAELNLKGVPGNLLESLKSFDDYKEELGEIIDKMIEFTKKYGSKFKKGEVPEELNQLKIRSSELVLLIEFTQQFDLLRK